MVVYTFLLVFSLILAYLYDKYIKKDFKAKIFFGVIIFMMFWGVQAISSDVGTDYSGTYTGLFEEIKNNKLKSNLDLGFLFIYKLIIFLNFDLQLFFVISSFLINFFVFKAIFSKSENVFWNIYIYFFGVFFFFSMTGIRQSLAMAMFYYSLFYIKEKNIKKYLFINILATLMHFSAIVMLPLYWFLDKRYSMKLKCSIIILLLLTIPIMKEILYAILINTKYGIYFYATDVEVATKINLSSIINILIFIIFSINYNKNDDVKNDSLFNIYFNLHYIGVLATIFMLHIPLVHRFIVYFKHLEIISVPYLFNTVSNLKGKKYETLRWINIMLAIIYILYFCYNIIYMNYNDCLPYKTIFNK